MAGNIIEIRKQLKSLKNSAKITKAVELVAGSKMRRAVSSALKTRSYSQMAWYLARHLVGSVELAEDDYLRNFLYQPEKQSGVILVVVSSNRGLCGAFNSNVVKTVIQFLTHQHVDQIICIGKKVAELLKAKGITPDQVYIKDENAKEISSIKNVSDYLYNMIKEKKASHVFLAFTDFKSALSQTPVIKLLFPFKFTENISGTIENTIGFVPDKELVYKNENSEYLYEPNVKDILNRLVPTLAETVLFQALLESNASEHSARMFAMKNATEVALEMHEGLSLVFNKTRQAGITQELAEISAGRMALEN